MTTTNGSNRRKDERFRSTATVFFKRPGESGYQIALTLETSRTGLALAWRGDTPPAPGTVVHIQDDPTKLSEEPATAVVKRVDHAHEDLVVIALARLDRPGELAATAEAPMDTALARPVVTVLPMKPVAGPSPGVPLS